jgi:group I intron endonuclease
MEKGIYKIVNKKNGKYYIGSDSRISKGVRWSDHKSKLRRGVHYNPHLQRAWDKYGESSFQYEIMDTFNNISSEKLSDIEQKYLNEAHKEKEKCYNVIFGVRNYRRISQLRLNRSKEELAELNRIRLRRYYKNHIEKMKEKNLDYYFKIKKFPK